MSCTKPTAQGPGQMLTPQQHPDLCWKTTGSTGQGRVKASSSTTPRSFPSQGCGNNAAIRLYLPFAPGSFMTYSSPLMTTAASFQSRAPSPEARALPSPPPPLKPHHLQLKVTARRRLQTRLPSPLCALHQAFGTIPRRGRDVAVAAGSGWEQGKKDPSKGKEQTAVCDTAALKEDCCGHHRLVARLFPTSTAPPDDSRAVSLTWLHCEHTPNTRPQHRSGRKSTQGLLRRAGIG